MRASLFFCLAILSLPAVASAQAEEKEQQRTLLQALRKEANTNHDKLKAANEVLIQAGEALAKATDANREAEQKKVDALKAEVQGLATSLRGMVLSLQEKGEDMKRERKLLFDILGEDVKKPEQPKTEEQIKEELDKLDKGQLFSRMGIEYAKYKGTVETVAAKQKAAGRQKGV